MRGRRPITLAVAALAAGVSLAAASSAWASGYAITATCTSAGKAAACGAGWYTSSVAVSWVWTPDNDGSNPTSGCTPHAYAVNTSSMASCTVRGPLGTTSVAVPIHVEISSPTVAGAPTRGPDSNGWYNHPVTIAFGGSSFSGIASCTSAIYSGPSTPSARASGSCTDNAGKTVTATSAPFAYAATPPALGMSADTGDRVTVVNWRMSDVAPSSRYELIRQPGLHGKRQSVLYKGLNTSFRDRRVDNGVRYRYTVNALDAAGNGAVSTIVVRPGLRLLAPTPEAQMTAPPLLRWTAVRGASYYNVQLFRGKRKVLSMWPGSATLQLQAIWRFRRHRYHFKPGTYRWYVWPGYGKRSAARYGHKVGTSTFTVNKTP
jgi:hypothetical protein